MESPQAYGITRQRVSLLRIDAIHHFVMIPYAPSSRFHTAGKLRMIYTPYGVICFAPLALPAILWYNEGKKGGIASINTAKENAK